MVIRDELRGIGKVRKRKSTGCSCCLVGINVVVCEILLNWPSNKNGPILPLAKGSENRTKTGPLIAETTFFNDSTSSFVAAEIITPKGNERSLHEVRTSHSRNQLSSSLKFRDNTRRSGFSVDISLDSDDPG